MISDFKTDIKTLAPYVGGYAIFCSFIHTVIYWSCFDVNPFLFIGISDLISQSIMPLSLAVIITLLYMGKELVFKGKDKLKLNESSDVRLIAIIIVISTLFFTLTFLGFWFQFLAYAASVVGLQLIRPIKNLSIIKNKFKNGTSKLFVASIIVTSLVYSITYPITIVTSIKLDRSNTSRVYFGSEECLTGCVFLGKLGSEIIYLNSKQETKIINTGSMNSFKISPNL